MTAATFIPLQNSAPVLIDAAATAGADTVTHQPWCTEHWSDDAVCWAEDLVLQVRPAVGDDDGRITAVMTHGSRTDANGAPAVNVTLFSDTVRDGEGSVEFCPDEAEVAAHALLAMVMRSRGFTDAGEWHEVTAKRCAAELLARRSGGAK